MAAVTAEIIDRACNEIKPLKLFDNWKSEQVEKMLQLFRLDGKTMLKMADIYKNEMELGLADKPSSLQMENTYIPELPNGTEEGQYLALDLGGTNFRVILVNLEKGIIVNEKVKHYHISDELRLNCGIKLFDFLAECISEFVIEHGLADRVLPMGFTFSFPMHQHALDSGILKVWTKSFACPGVEGKDAVKLLNDAIHRRGDNHVELICVLNDTTGTLMQGATLDKNTAIGLILGTGTNACYLERADRVQHWEVERHGEKQVVIDIEWGAFGDNGCIDFVKTDFDRTVDEKSLIPKSFTFEKKIGGKFMGELVQVVLCSLTGEGLLFNGVPSESLLEHGHFRTSFVSGIEQDSIDGVTKDTEKILQDLQLDYDEDDIKVVQYVCHLVSLRAAQFLAICVSQLLIRMDKPTVTIAVDGSLFKYHPRLRIWMEKYTKLLAPNHPFKIVLVQDGSGKGAALVSAIAKRITEKY